MKCSLRSLQLALSATNERLFSRSLGLRTSFVPQFLRSTHRCFGTSNHTHTNGVHLRSTVIPRGQKIDGEYHSVYRSAGIIPFSFVDRDTSSPTSSASTRSNKELVLLLGQTQRKQKRAAMFLSALESSSGIIPSEPLVPQTKASPNTTTTPTTTSSSSSSSPIPASTSTTPKPLYWSEFGGKKEDNVDKDIEATAVREFIEETCGIWEAQSDEFYRTLKDENMRGPCVWNPAGKYFLFFLHIPYVSPSILRKALLQNCNHTTQLASSSPPSPSSSPSDTMNDPSHQHQQLQPLPTSKHYLEKSDFGWVSLSHVVKLLQEKSSVKEFQLDLIREIAANGAPIFDDIKEKEEESSKPIRAHVHPFTVSSLYISKPIFTASSTASPSHLCLLPPPQNK